MHLDDVLTELVEHCGDRLLRVAYQLTHDAAAAQDLVQEALLPRLPVGTPSRSRAGGLVRLLAPCGDQRIRPHSPAAQQDRDRDRRGARTVSAEEEQT